MKQPTTLLGQKFWYEAYLQKSTMDGAMWDKTIEAVTGHLGLLRSLKIVMTIQENMVHYYFGANKNLSELSNALEHMSLRPIDSAQIKLAQPTSSERFVQFVTGGNLIDLRERTSVNRGSELEMAIFSIRRISLETAVSCSIDLLFRKADGTYSASHKQTFAQPGRLLAVNFRENEKYGYKKTSRHLDIKKALHILKSNETGAFLEVETYPYLQQNAYLDLASYDFDKHSFIVGASGSGKSKMIGLMVDRLLKSPMATNYRVVVIDPHASLEEDLRDLPGANILNFRSNDASTGLFAEGSTDISASTELTVTLFQSLLGAQYTAGLERVLRYSLTVLMTAQVMSLQNLRRFLTDESYRISVLSHVQEYIPTSVATYFANEYAIAQAQQHAEVLLPILELVDEIDLRSNASGSSQASSLAHVVTSNPLTVFSLNKVAMGEKVIKTVSGLLISQLFLLAQARQFNEKIILIIDEVSVIQNPALAQILAEARKYNLFVFLSQQYFGQVEKSLQDAIFSNVSNYYVFKVSESDACALEGNITMELPRKIMMEATRTIMSEEDKRVPILTSLDPHECIVRISSGGKLLPAFKARTLDFTATKNASHEKAQPLQSFKQQAMPAKYVEQHNAQSTTAVSHKPQFVAEPPENLMQVLSRQSSRRNNRKA